MVVVVVVVVVVVAVAAVVVVVVVGGLTQTRGRSEAADGLVDPLVEGWEARVDPRQVGAAAADAETHHAHLEPLALLLADQRTASVSLRHTNTNR